MTSLFDLTGRRALVTGSSRGIGLALATGLAENGADVVLHGRDQTALANAAATLERVSGRAPRTIAFDVTDADEVDAAITELEAEAPIDVLVNNAGIQRRAPIAEFDLGDWNDLVATNLTSAFLTARRVSREMIGRGAGKIVNIGSVQSQLGRANIAPYAATKGGIAMLTKGLCADLGPHGIQVNALAPGYFATELTKALVDDADFSDWVAKRTPAGRWGRTEELVGTLVFLSSGASDFVNGQVVFVDGGMTAVV
ncbi:SDR family oxidoreductase [Schumannella luteola]|uniref:Gluconate 5-dehydrogenase n=1 Tax=Schumannella luteola TaxID=472059 RepID=A0A852Y705_9MICO|nr:SDR family oxidoreductase [Schumannella luteola]NYG97652.1 gluconate 5-dehydrogenase [Schumannella luteola]TPX04701.1 SDR family oxidoreductase [Schumannella luteola]